jgi:tungstate transport system substrate-binding protein
VVEEERCFVSRGDASGTHMREQAMWRAWAEDRNVTLAEGDDGTRPDGDWYLSIGQGMGAAITMADEKRCVTLSDAGTALFRQADTDLTRLAFEDETMLNPYSIIPLDGPRLDAAEALQTFLLGEGVALIAGHTVNGEALFTPGQP